MGFTEEADAYMEFINTIFRKSADEKHGLRIMLERCLQHSGTLPLTLRFTEFSRSVALLESHRDRIVSLTVKVRSDEDTAALQTLLAKGMPKLTTLQLSSANGQAGSFTSPLTAGYELAILLVDD